MTCILNLLKETYKYLYMPFLSEEQISKMNFKSVGKNVKISDKAPTDLIGPHLT